MACQYWVACSPYISGQCDLTDTVQAGPPPLRSYLVSLRSVKAGSDPVTAITPSPPARRYTFYQVVGTDGNGM